MADLFLFDRSDANALEVYTQNNTTGFPVYSVEDEAESIYKDSYPQLIRLSESVAYGDLLHVSYGGSGVYAVRATADNPMGYANSVALVAGNRGDLIYCGVRSATLRGVFSGTGPMFLSTNPGQMAQTVSMGEITQCVGWVYGGNFHFHFHTPSLNSPFDYSHIETNYG